VVCSCFLLLEKLAIACLNFRNMLTEWKCGLHLCVSLDVYCQKSRNFRFKFPENNTFPCIFASTSGLNLARLGKIVFSHSNCLRFLWNNSEWMFAVGILWNVLCFLYSIFIWYVILWFLFFVRRSHISSMWHVHFDATDAVRVSYWTRNATEWHISLVCGSGLVTEIRK